MEAEVRGRTGLNVVALEAEGTLVSGPPPGNPLPSDRRLLAVGTPE